MRGNVNPLVMLSNEHRAAEELFKRLASSKHTNREGTIESLIKELSLHAELEEEIVYPAVRRYVQGGRRLANQASEDHAQVAAMLDELSALDPYGSEADGLIQELHQMVREHVAEEEGPDGLFAQLRAEMDEASMREMSNQLVEAKMERAISNPAPEAGHKPPPKEVGGRMFHGQP